MPISTDDQNFLDLIASMYTDIHGVSAETHAIIRDIMGDEFPFDLIQDDDDRFYIEP
jgi:hypothetical protein